MEETNLVIIALVALALLVVLVWYTLSNRLQAVNGRVHELQQKNEELTRLLEELQAQKVAAPAVAAEEKTPAQAEEAPAAAAAPETAKAAAEAAATEGELSPEIVAVIMAAVAACGYDPAAIRSIRPQQRHSRSHNWVMAGRLAGMR
ncbi:hypothetical protein [Megasphaera hominis]|jgi:TolA-binding protein|uniref:Oxaloacetate decarboxylase, gamma chain n=1 Tax=Megasphaera hominis TaxID=159836 RepID=A0ABR6VGM3_9FIRM|nr:hypothetical protein [Megasphaera hominis]MBC3536386.1 hypothetical protein [Megasphaera hominis]